jgi:hypothetical protein
MMAGITHMRPRRTVGRSSGWRLRTATGMTLLMTVACVSTTPTSASPTKQSPATEVSFAAPTDTDCRPPSPETNRSEVKGTRLWALVFAEMPIKAARDTKIVWRMSGHGAFHIAAKTTDGKSARLTFGPEPHGGSSWDIPDTDEWGSGFIFPTAGCWRVHASRDDLAGDVYFLVTG